MVDGHLGIFKTFSVLDSVPGTENTKMNKAYSLPSREGDKFPGKTLMMINPQT